MRHLDGVVTGPRPGRMRDRRGRGHRGPLALPGPLSPGSVPRHRTARSEFDELVGLVLTALDKHFAAEPDRVDVVVEDVPLLPPEWDEAVPLSSVSTVRDDGPAPAGPDAAPGDLPRRDVTRLVLYRLPITGRARSEAELVETLWDVVLERLAEIWHVSPDDLDPR